MSISTTSSSLALAAATTSVETSSFSLIDDNVTDEDINVEIEEMVKLGLQHNPNSNTTSDRSFLSHLHIALLLYSIILIELSKTTKEISKYFTTTIIIIIIIINTTITICITTTIITDNYYYYYLYYY